MVEAKRTEFPTVREALDEQISAINRQAKIAAIAILLREAHLCSVCGRMATLFDNHHTGGVFACDAHRYEAWHRFVHPYPDTMWELAQAPHVRELDALAGLGDADLTTKVIETVSHVPIRVRGDQTTIRRRDS